MRCGARPRNSPNAARCDAVRASTALAAQRGVELMSVLDLPSRGEEAWRWADMPALQRLPRRRAPPRRHRSRSTSAARGWCSSTACSTPAQSDPGRADASARSTLATDHPLGRTRDRQRLVAGARPPRRPRPGRDRPRLDRAARTMCPRGSCSPRTRSRRWSRPIVGTGWANRLTQVDAGHVGAAAARGALLQDDGFVSTRDEVTVGQGASLCRDVPRRGRHGQPDRRADRHRRRRGALPRWAARC